MCEDQMRLGTIWSGRRIRSSDNGSVGGMGEQEGAVILGLEWVIFVMNMGRDRRGLGERTTGNSTWQKV